MSSSNENNNKEEPSSSPSSSPPKELLAGEGALSGGNVSPSKLQPGAATPANTPNANLFPKTAAAGASEEKKKRNLGDVEKVNDALGALSMDDSRDKNATQEPKNKKKADKKPAPTEDEVDDEDEDEVDDEDDEVDDEDDGEDDEEEDEYIATLEEREAALPALTSNQTALNALQTEFLREMRELTIKYQGLRAPLYAARKQSIAGLNGFWIDTMKRHPLLAEFIEEHDDACLMHLTDVTCKDIVVKDAAEGKEKEGFELEFHFAEENPFFTNRVLKKTLFLSNLYSYKTPDVDESIGTEIQWKPSKNLTVTIQETRAPGGRGRGNNRRGGRGGGGVVRTVVPQPSFFQFFGTRKDLTDEEVDALTNEEYAEYSNSWSMDFAIASVFRDKIIPDALSWYQGEETDSQYEDEEEEGEEDGEGEDEDEDEEDEEDDDDEDDDDDDDDEGKKDEPRGETKGKAKRGDSGAPKSSAGGAAGAEGDKAECKQQ